MSKLKSISYENIIRTLRNALITNTNVPATRIINATSVRGPDIFKLLNSTEAISPDLADAFIIFELTENQDNDNYGATSMDDNHMETIMSYDLNLKIYGNDCHILSQTILARFKSAEVALSVRDEGVWIYGISKPESLNEFINNTIWPRCDMKIKVMARFEIVKKIKESDVESYSDINII